MLLYILSHQTCTRCTCQVRYRRFVLLRQHQNNTLTFFSCNTQEKIFFFKCHRSRFNFLIATHRRITVCKCTMLSDCNVRPTVPVFLIYSWTAFALFLNTIQHEVVAMKDWTQGELSINWNIKSTSHFLAHIFQLATSSLTRLNSTCFKMLQCILFSYILLFCSQKLIVTIIIIFLKHQLSSAT